jgi:hypothetical protein
MVRALRYSAALLQTRVETITSCQKQKSAPRFGNGKETSCTAEGPQASSSMPFVCCAQGPDKHLLSLKGCSAGLTLTAM